MNSNKQSYIWGVLNEGVPRRTFMILLTFSKQPLPAGALWLHTNIAGVCVCVIVWVLEREEFSRARNEKILLYQAAKQQTPTCHPLTSGQADSGQRPTLKVSEKE